MKYLIIILALSFSAFSSKAQSKIKENLSELNELVNIMQGNYSSENQALADTTYFNISLKMVPIWKDRGNFLYVEQALVTKIDKPYRVRIYKISQNNANQFVSEIYTLKNEKDWIGRWSDPNAFDRLLLSDVELKKGCEVTLKRIDKNKFIGETGEKTCASELRGAKYATSKVTVTSNQILSWDQGFDNEGKQVWGAEKGGYIFVKL